MAYGELKVDSITFTNGGTDTTVSVSGLVQNPTFSGDITVTGTISGDVVQGGTLVSGATVSGTTGEFGTITGNTAGFTTVTGITVTGTTANFATLSGTTVTGGAGQFTSLTSTTATITSGVFASGTEAAPSVSVGTTDNGIYSPDTDQVAISTNGTGRLFVNSSGNVGINNENQTAQLTIGTSNNATTPLRVFSSSSDNSIECVGRSTNNRNVFQYYNYDGTTKQFKIIGTQDQAQIFHELTGDLVLGTNNTERLRIDSSGNVGIGTSSPAELLDIDGSGNSYLRWESNGATGSYSTSGGLLRIGPYFVGADRELALFGDNSNRFWVTTGAANDLLLGVNKTYRIGIRNTGVIEFRDSSSEFARFDLAGRLLLGTSSAVNVGGYASTSIQSYLQSSSATSAAIISTGANAAGSFLHLAKSRGGTSTIVAANDTLGAINFAGADGTDIETPAARITAEVDGTPGANDMPGRLVFSTTADGASSPTERARITNDGYLRLAGKGIQFNGDTADANSLDDYEEGTWTPTGGTWTSAGGYYTKVGRTVIATGWASAGGGQTLTLDTIGGLPFAFLSNAAGNGSYVVYEGVSNPSTASIYIGNGNTINASSTSIKFYPTFSRTNTGVAGGDRVQWTIVYQV